MQDSIADSLKNKAHGFVLDTPIGQVSLNKLIIVLVLVSFLLTTVVSLISWKKVSSEKYKVDAGIYFDSLYDRVYERIREPLTSSRILASNFRTAKKIAKERNLTDEESILVHISFLRNLQKDFQYDRVYIVDNSNKKYIYNGGIMPIIL